MKLLLALLTTLLSLISLASSANTVKFINHCPYDIYFWKVGPALSKINDGDADRTMVPANGGSIIHNMENTESFGGGLSIKIRDVPYFAVSPAGIIQVEYHLEPSTNAMWYDLSAVDCDFGAGPESPKYCPLIRGGIKLYVPKHPKGHCPPAYCDKDKCWNTYVSPGGFLGEPSLTCWAGLDIFVETCTNGPGIQTFHGPDPNALDAVRQAIPEQVVQPSLAPSNELKASPNGECGGETGFTCSSSQHGLCCSKWGYCGNRANYCNDGCQSSFGACLAEGEFHPRVAGPEPFIVATATSVVTQTTTATETETETESVTVLHTLTATAVSTSKPGAFFTPPPLKRARRGGAVYVNM